MKEESDRMRIFRREKKSSISKAISKLKSQFKNKKRNEGKTKDEGKRSPKSISNKYNVNDLHFNRNSESFHP